MTDRDPSLTPPPAAPPLPDHPAAARAQIDEMLRGAGLRVTRQRQAIAEVLLRAADHPDAEAVLDRARRIDPSVSQATTYRTLATLTDKGFLRQHRFDAGPARFEAEPAAHHDHLIDVDSGEVIEFVSAEIEALQARVAARYGYRIVDHHLVLFGRRIEPGPEAALEPAADA
ncbi:transcriptional repressor [Paracoccus sanguinis]|nr:transcriptional repressor [Paracoccus sanguinis]